MNALVLLAVLAAPPAPVEDTCTLNAKAIKPQLAKKLPKGFKLVSSKKDAKARVITETLKLPDGLEVQTTLGGCEHLAFTIGIKGPTITSKTVGAELVAIVRRVLPTIPVASDAHLDPKLLLKAVEDARISVMPAQLPCGDANCELSLAPIEEKTKKPKQKDDAAGEKPARLMLSYDFPL